MNPDAPDAAKQAVEYVTRTETWAALSIAAAGLIFLILGIRLIRPIATIVLAGAGFGIGMLIHARGDVGGVDKMPAAAIIGMTAGLLAGYFFYRIWLMLWLGVICGVVAAGGWFALSHRDETQALTARVEHVYLQISPFLEALHSEEDLKKLEHLDNPERMAASGATPEQMQLAHTLKEVLPLEAKALWESVCQTVRDHAVGLSIAGAVGLALGVLLAGAAWRLSAILVTSIYGVCLLSLGAWGTAARLWPEGLAKLQNIGDAVWLLPIGAWLTGMVIQFRLSRDPRPVPQPVLQTPPLPPLPPRP